MDQPCEHLASLTWENVTKPDSDQSLVCEECIKTGDSRVHLRTCQTCGQVLCCDSSPNRHMTKHCHTTSHPVIISAQPGEQWAYCYPRDQMKELS